jgi:hypothetical protein
MRRQTFDLDAKILSTVTLEKLETAQKEEEKNVPISDPAIQLLKKHIYATGGRVMGSDQSRYQLRSQIWSTCIMLNPPSLWITINPCDLHDPIAQVFAGENINMDDLAATLNPPSKEKRAQNIALDPYAAAKFFHFMIRTILRTLFGVEATQHQVKSRIGVFGPVTAYFGVIESQGRGSLHLHMLIWLKNSPPSEEMEDLLQQEEFRDRIKAFIKANLRAYLSGFESAESIKNISNDNEVAWSRPPNPDSATYDIDAMELERRVARTMQVHTCEFRRCLVPDKNGQYRCKRRAPFELSEEDCIDEQGHWKSKRLFGFLNGWVPAITLNARCNNDGKLLTNGTDTKNVTFYVTIYQTKKQGKHYNMSALLAKGYAYHSHHTAYLDSLRDNQRLLLFRLIHTINREQELAAPMVISYLMGWGDTYRSHHYSPVYWSSFVSALLKVFAALNCTKGSEVEGKDSNSGGGAAR